MHVHLFWSISDVEGSTHTKMRGVPIPKHTECSGIKKFNLIGVINNI